MWLREQIKILAGDVLCSFGSHDRHPIAVRPVTPPGWITPGEAEALYCDCACAGCDDHSAGRSIQAPVLQRDEWLFENPDLDQWFIMRLGPCVRPGCDQR